MFLPLSILNEKVVYPWGPRPLFEAEDDVIVVVSMQQLAYDVVFPPVSFDENSLKRNFNTLDADTRQYMLDIVECGVTHNLTRDEKEALWERRHFLTHIPDALPLVLASAVGWDWASLTNIYQLLDDWMPFADLTVREKAVSWLKTASSDFLFNFLPELVEAITTADQSTGQSLFESLQFAAAANR
ncbi:unnamed protein product [Gongylonema pulchrum]|uniref:PIK helical domain-containing protein n=1 Tax=Gongylonema pulchrum TaxID=637853 RepID=A0A3P7QCQ4_9BILA|nr:unnamed protein product [Gongylonema pulchrum]